MIGQLGASDMLGGMIPRMAREDDLPILEYATRVLPSGRPEATGRDRVIYFMAWAWFANCLMSGISGDRTYIPYEKRLAISGSGAVIAALLWLTASRRDKWGWALTFQIVAMMEVAVMWFWN